MHLQVKSKFKNKKRKEKKIILKKAKVIGIIECVMIKHVWTFKQNSIFFPK